jgi:two-component system, NtrC family, response regulator AtoC
MSRPDDLATDLVLSNNEAGHAASRDPGQRIVFFWEGGSTSAKLEHGTMTLGRVSSATITVEHPSVSRAHALLHVGDAVFIEDLGSANGTKIDGTSIGPGRRVPVRPGAVGVLGAVHFVLFDAGGARAEQPATGAMQRLDQLVELVAKSDISVILQAETGAGKEVLAERIHRQSGRRDGPFVRLNCAAIPEPLLESELFGHERGAFTGATIPKVGLMETAHGGTLFFDELGEMPLGVQAKVLRAIESREVTRLGSVRPRAIDVRFVSATNRDLALRVAEGAFRSDLFFRMNGITITVPPLRERAGDVERLACVFAEEAAKRLALGRPRIGEQAMARLRAHRWPGNVRELKNVVERAVLLAQGRPIEVEHIVLGDALGVAPQKRGSADADAGAPDVRLPDALASMERDRIADALERSGGNQSEAAKLLGISRRTLVYRLDQYDLPRPRKR